MKTTRRLSRRTFLKTATAGAAGAALAPSLAFGARREPLRFAQIGCGGKGESDRDAMLAAGAKLVALCDVDEANAKKVFMKHADLPKYKDYRELLDKHEKEIDGVVVSTPDHVHAAAALEAMRRGKHVYVQKPLARTFAECQAMLDLSRKQGVVTQMGNQGHAGSGLKLWEEMAKAGAFGDIREIHTWSDRPIWAQGMTEAPKEAPVPATLDWNHWLGPAADRPYSKAYVPFSWRGWWDFGCGAMGDMACHNMDPAFWIFKLGLPLSIKAQASAPAGIAYPTWSIIEYKFGPTPLLPNGVTLKWYDGHKLPAAPPGANPDLKIDTNGCMVIGSKMTAMGGSHAGKPHVVAVGDKTDGDAIKEADKHWQDIHKTLNGTDHYAQWVHAAEAKDREATKSNFDYAAPFTQGILLGCIALRFPGQELLWDNGKKQVSNFAEANPWLSFKPREGYNLNA
ncbi:MAG TPA: Gfo/Idh/MocA family oxidoreductase [Planctomycetota bacterium]|nr:Gfo/Idh/MocA family oxidoreductase [Planctomycetota bacterium]